MKLLYIDNNRLLIDKVKKLLDLAYVVDFARTGSDGFEKASGVEYGLILLDLRLPDMNGAELCRKLRSAGITVPILILSFQKDPAIAVQLLNDGADDFIAKPFNGEELKARIAALLRRNQYMHHEKVIELSGLTVNVTSRRVWRDGVNIVLRRKEFDILEYLATNHGRILTRSMIIDHVWESGTEGWNNTVDVHIKHIRDKVDRPFKSALIKTAHGVGYMIDDKI